MSRETDLKLPDNNIKETGNAAKSIIVIYNVVGFLAGFYMLFGDKLSGVIIVLIYPLLGIIIALFSGGNIKLIDNGKKWLVESINAGFMVSIVFLCLNSVDVYTLFQTNNLWLPVIVTSLVVSVMIFKTGIKPGIKQDGTSSIFMYILAIAYGYGAAREINCTFDKSAPQIYHAVVLNKTEHKGKSNSYYFTLTPWGPMTRVKQQEIDGLLYNHTKIGDTVKVNFKQGLLHIPWFVVVKN
ncbi:hypothetical protein [Mucilaginibacter sp.]